MSLSLSRHFSLSFIASGRSSGIHLVSSHSCCIYVRAGRPTFAWPYAGVHRSTSLMSSSLFLQQCPACLVRLTCIDLKGHILTFKDVKWPRTLAAYIESISPSQDILEDLFQHPGFNVLDAQRTRLKIRWLYPQRESQSPSAPKIRCPARMVVKVYFWKSRKWGVPLHWHYF